MDGSKPAFEDAFHKTIVDNIADGVYYVDRDRTITYWNHGAERLTGYRAADVVGKQCFANLLAHVDEQGNALCFTLCPLASTMGDGEVREAQVWLRHQEGYRRPVRVRAAPVRDAAGEIVGAVEVFDDATRLVEARAQAEAAQHDALTDTLTTLPNRRHFDAALGGRLENLRRYGWQFGLLIADIDRFKLVNDELGHEVGDEALRTVALTIAGGVRAGDLAARWGGEEFAILVASGDADSLRGVAERIRVLVARSQVPHPGGNLRMRVSIGGAMAVPGEPADELVARADAALYRAKDAGRDRVEIEVRPPGPPSGASGAA